ncbi:TonB-dependent receptor [Lewinellaceae bacterium SD302]|nr:TonB-dependent receptor [Lewinellaceae bacterium SD302]
MSRYYFLVLCSLFSISLFAQTGVIRGNVIDEGSGEPISFGTVRLIGTELAVNTDLDGFFSFGNLEQGSYTVQATYLGYDSTNVTVELNSPSDIEFVRIGLKSASVQLNTVSVSARREQARSDVKVSKISVSSEEILALPSTGGEPDIAQYLSVLPGVVSSGDQGGQLYIRGGSPVQNKILLDGMVIYNPFHSIGLFSVFETEAIRGVDVYTGGFNAEFGGRISAIVDINTRDGNKKEFSGLVSGSPFQAKVMLEGPIKKLDPKNGSSISFLITGKQALLPETSKQLYSYAIDDNFFNLEGTGLTGEDIGLPYNYTDLYGKVNFSGSNGSELNLFAFNFLDDFDVPGVAALDWSNGGGGASFKLVPPGSSVVMDGNINYSSYDVNLLQADDGPRRSKITNYGALLNFSYFGKNSQIKYGFDFNSFNTDFEFQNPLGLTFNQADFTTELNGFFKLKQTIGNLIIEPGLRVQFYASQSTLSVEPRFGAKYNATDALRFKAAGGIYSQNLISTQNDLDIVNFFTGYLAGPEETILDPTTGEATKNRIQKAFHAVGGFELDITNELLLNIEGYFKGFTQLIELNRNKTLVTDPNFTALTGDAYGGDISLEYRKGRLAVTANYTLGWVDRDNGDQVFATSFDRRHNVNAFGTYRFGKDNAYEFGLRWNYGSAFPFTQTQGFYESPTAGSSPIILDILTNNGELNVLLASQINGGRLADFHRLDASLKRTFSFGGNLELDIVASITNVYDRDNIFFVNRTTNERVNQLPILPSLAGTFRF